MATTTNYSWTTPDDTSLVKDGAAAIRSLGSSIDTTTKALNPSTTLGDIEYRSATANTNTRLGIGTSGQVLAVNGSGVPAWTTVSSGGMTAIASGSLSGTNVDLTSIPTTYKSLQLVLRNVSPSANTGMTLRINGDTTTSYRYQSIDNGIVTNRNDTGLLYLTDVANLIAASSTQGNFVIDIPDYSSVSSHNLTWTAGYLDSNTSATVADFGIAYYRPTTNAAITQLRVANLSTTTFDSGTYTLYGVN